MEFYSILTKLLEKANELKALENQKKVDFSEKKNIMKKFIKLLISFLNYNTQSEESNNFRIYFIEYLDKLIDSSYDFCSKDEKNEIENLRKKIKNNYSINIDNSKIKNENLINNNINYDIKNKKSENYELIEENLEDNKNNNSEKSDSKIFSLNNINQEPFYPKNFKIKNQIQNDFISNNIKVNNIYEEKNQNFKFQNINEEENNLIHSKDNLKINDNTNYEDFNNNKNKINDGAYFSKNNKIYNNDIIEENVINENNFNKNINCNNINNKINYNKNKENEEEKKAQNNYNYENINGVEFNEKKLNKKKHSKKINNKKIVPIPSQQYQNEIKNYYDELFNKNICQFFIKGLLSDKTLLNNKCTKLFKLVENNKMEYIEQSYKEKLTTLICLLFYFSKGQKETIGDYIYKSDLEIDEKIFKFLKKNILNPDLDYIDFTLKKIENVENKFCNDLKHEKENKGINLIYTIYIFLIVARCLRNCCENKKDYLTIDKLLRKEYFISFKIQFILRHQEYYDAISKDFIDIFHGLKFINNFFSKVFTKEDKYRIIIKYNKENNDYIDNIDNKDNENKNKETAVIFCYDEDSDLDINSLFSEKDNKIYDEVMDKIEHFFSINKFNSDDMNDLIYYSTSKIANKEYNFILNIVELVIEKNNNINNIEVYKRALQKLEKNIYKLGIETLNIGHLTQENKINQYSINQEKKYKYELLLEEINQKIDNKYKKKFNLYPYGSITQFLGGNSSDIDLYLDIRQMGKKEKIKFLWDLKDVITDIIGANPNLVISTRLCVISFKYKYTPFDISLMGLCPYYHSILFRQYSFIDSRFPLLAITLKKFIEIVKLKNDGNKNDFLNSFSWMVLLVTFLQDIINPPILPKLLTNQPKKNYTIQYAQNYSKFRAFNNFVDSIREENIFMPNFSYDKNTLKEIYNKQIENKNNLSCSEIFLYFLEFIIFYFKSDSVYANFSPENEGYENMYYILNNNFENGKGQNNKNPQNNMTDERFQEYFKYKYYRIRNYYDNKKAKDGMILIRDTFDPHYNPGQTLKARNYKTFMDNLKKGYLILLESGDFNQLKKEFTEKINDY